jgi:type IV secretory pathway TrbF-like protein
LSAPAPESRKKKGIRDRIFMETFRKWQERYGAARLQASRAGFFGVEGIKVQKIKDSAFQHYKGKAFGLAGKIIDFTSDFRIFV